MAGLLHDAALAPPGQPADALLEFDQRRAAVPAMPTGPRRRKAAPVGAIEYF
jgi:hypothetical protein